MKTLKDLEILVRQLEPGLKERDAIMDKTTRYVNDYIARLPEMPSYQQGNLDMLESLAITEDGKSFDDLLNILRQEVDSVGINTASGAHLGFIPGGGLWVSAVADMLAAATNRYSGVAYSCPGAVKIENQLIEWLRSIVGYPVGAHGNLTSGGSIASLIAVKTARDFHKINSSNVRQSVIYFSEQMHHCMLKAFSITGVHEAVSRPIPMNESFQMDVDALETQIESDIAEGLNPFMIVGSAGTTDTGAIDPLDRIADLCEKHDIWFHVDGAYGGFFVLVDELKEKFRGIERSDSVVLDPHKTLVLPYGSGAVLIRHRDRLTDAFSQSASYMKDTYAVEDLNPADVSPELTKHFRGLRMWLPLHLHGVKPFRANLQEKYLLCQYLHRSLTSMGLETGPEPQLSVAIFRFPGDNDVNQRLLEAILSDGRVFLTSTTIKEKLWIRCAVVSHRSHMAEVQLALETIRESLESLGLKAGLSGA